MQKCPQCQSELEKTESGNFYCPTDDLTFTVEKGKQKPGDKEPSKGRLKIIEEDLAHVKKRQAELDKELHGDDAEEIW